MIGTTELAAIDTNVLLRLILGDDAEMFARARKLLLSHDKYFLVPDLVITEVIYVLKNTPQFSNRFVQVDVVSRVLRSAKHLDYNEELFSRVFAMYEEHPKLSFNDCYLACRIEELQREPLYTFDQKLAKQTAAAELVP